MAFKSLGSLLPTRLRQSGIAQPVQAARVVAAANEVLEEMFGAGTTQSVAQAMSYQMRRLQVATLHSAFRQELKWRQAEFTQAVNQRAGDGAVVEEIQFIL